MAQTRAFSTLYLATVALACLWADHQDLFDSIRCLPEVGGRILNNYASLSSELGRDPGLERFYWLGSGVRHGLACELSLKMKEMSLTHSEPFHFLEFRHGPKSMVTASTCVLGMQSSTNLQPEAAVLGDILALGGRVVEVGIAAGLDRLSPGLDEALSSLLFLPVGQLIAFHRSCSKGLDPDLPHNLDAVVKLPGGAKG